MTSVSQSQNQTPSSVTSTTSSSSVFKYDPTNTVANATTIATSNSSSIKTDFTSSLEQYTTIDKKASTVPTSSLSSTDSSNVFSTAVGAQQPVSSSYSQFQSNTLNPSERINPFDKNKQTVAEKATISKVTETTSSGSTATSSTSSSYTSTVTGSTFDDPKKNRYDLDSESTKIPSSDFNSTKSEPTSKPVTANQRTSAAKYAFGTAQYSTGSMSDSEIIFGSTDQPDRDSYSKRSQYGHGTSSTVDASNSIYETGRNLSSFNRSLSVSSDTNGDFANDPRVNTSYRIYEGIQNAAFQDFDSPVKTTPSQSSSAAAAASSETTASFSSTYVSGSKIFNDDDDYDLK